MRWHTWKRGVALGGAMFVPAPYMEWAKTHVRLAWDVSGSTLLPCTLADLPAAREAVELWDQNDEGLVPLREAIARRYRVPVDCVSTATGASGANFLVFAGLVGPGDQVLVERPGYDPLIAAARMAGATVTRFDRRFEDGFAVDIAEVRRALSPRTRLVVVTNAHNPSGVVIAGETLDELGREAERVGARVLVDEVYLDAAFVDGARPAAARGEVFISTNSLTKSYGLPGLRCGWVIAAPEVARRVRRTRDVVDGSGAVPAERMAVVAFAELDRLRARARQILTVNGSLAREFLASRAELEWVDPPNGLVVFPRLRGVSDATPFLDVLRTRYHTVVAPGWYFGAPAHFRIAMGGDRDVLGGALERIGHALSSTPPPWGRDCSSAFGVGSPAEPL